MIPIYQSKAEEIGYVLIEHVITQYCIPDCIIMDHESAFLSSLMNYLFSKLDMKIKTVAPCNHWSLQAEHGIKFLSAILMKHLTNVDQIWPKLLIISYFCLQHI